MPTALYGQIFYAAVVTTVAGTLWWVAWVYGTALHDQRYFDGWALAIGVGIQIFYHLRRQVASMSPKSAKAWKNIHVFIGYVIGILFLSHTNLSMPDSGFEFVLWASFVLITLSGILGTYLSWVVPRKLGPDDSTVYERIPQKRAELAREMHELVTTSGKEQSAIPLPIAPYEDWIMDLYQNHLRNFFRGQQHAMAHFVGSQRHLKKLMEEIDNLERFIDRSGQDKLAMMRQLVVDKDRLDFARVHLGLTRTWLFIHVPLTYTLAIMATLHVIVVYSFSSGMW